MVKKTNPNSFPCGIFAQNSMCLKCYLAVWVSIVDEKFTVYVSIMIVSSEKNMTLTWSYRNYQCNFRNCKDIPGCYKLHVGWINFTRYYEPLVFAMTFVSTMSCYPLETQHPFIKKMGYKRSIIYWKVGGCNRKSNVLRLVWHFQ